MKANIFLCALSLCAASTAFGEIPADYYTSCKGKNKGSLKSQLYTIIKSHTAIPYGSGDSKTWGAFRYTDVTENGYWWDIYTTNLIKADKQPGNEVMNIEHTFPKSWWGGTKNDAYKDIMHLMPVNSIANSTRSNWPYAEVMSAKPISNKCNNPRFKHGTPQQGQGGGCGTVFEPDDEFKGDLARTYFYMVTCYQNLTWEGNGLYTAQNGAYPTLQPWAIEMLLKWHREDPVSDKERDRNEAVYEQQHNRNPFIDHPELVEHIWGDKMDISWGGDISDPDPDPDPDLTKASLSSPINNDWYHFTGINPGQTLVMEIPVIGKHIKQNLTATISGTNASLFKIKVGNLNMDAVSINATDIVSESGYSLKVCYSPVAPTTAGGFDLATLTISGSDLEQSVSVNLQGLCEEEIELNAVTVLPAEDVTPTGYTVRWLPNAVEVDGYTVTRKIYQANEDTASDVYTYEVDGEHTSFVITDRDPAMRETVSVTAMLNGKESPAGNEIIIAADNGVDSIEIEDNGSVRYYDAAGFELPCKPEREGVYIVRIGNHTSKAVIIK